jgi:hypothetical protein
LVVLPVPEPLQVMKKSRLFAGVTGAEVGRSSPAPAWTSVKGPKAGVDVVTDVA